MVLEPVLIAEPDSAHAMAIAEMVRIIQPRIEPVYAHDGMSALNRLKDWRDQGICPLVVVVGEALSLTGGLAVLNYLTTDPVLSRVPVVTFSDVGLSPATQTSASEEWVLDILADANDPYDLLVRDLSDVLSAA